jgi:hypothetical protein
MFQIFGYHACDWGPRFSLGSAQSIFLAKPKSLIDEKTYLSLQVI